MTLKIVALTISLCAVAQAQLPQMPLGMKPKAILQSPKGAEQASTPMAVKVAPVAPVSPSGFTITRIAMTPDGVVTLEWSGGGPGPFTVEGRADGGWQAVLTTPDTTCSFQADVNRFWRVGYTSGTPPVSTTGDCELQRNWGGTTSSAGTVVKGMVSSGGSVVLAGLFYYSVNFGTGVIPSAGGQDGFVSKYSTDGLPQWVRRFGNVSDDTANGVAIDSQGNVIMAGGVSGAIWPAMMDFGFGPVQAYGGSDIIIAKFSPTGDLLWSKLFGGSGSDVCTAIGVDSADNILMTGTHGFFGSGADFGGGPLTTYGQQDVFLAKLSSNGSHIWSRSMGGSDSDAATSLAVTSIGEVVIAGQFRGTANFGTGPVTSAGDTDAYVAKYGADGVNIWFKRLGDLRGQSANGVAVDGAGNVYITGDFLGTIDFGGSIQTAALGGSFYVAKFNASGVSQWSKSFGAESNGPHAASIAVGNGDAVVSGEMITGIDFGSGWMLGQGGNDVMVVSFGQATGNVRWSKRGAPYGDRATASCYADKLFICGDCGSAGFDLGCASPATTPGTANNGWMVRLR